MSWSLESPYHATVMIVRHAPNNIQPVCDQVRLLSCGAHTPELVSVNSALLFRSKNTGESVWQTDQANVEQDRRFLQVDHAEAIGAAERPEVIIL